MNKKVKVILNILIAIAGIVFLVSFGEMVASFKYANRETENPAERTMSVFEYKLKHKAYGEILEDYYAKRLDSFEAPEGMEDLYRVAEYAHNAFMSRVYKEKKDKVMIRANYENTEKLRAQLGSYRYAADEVDDIVKNAP